MKLYLRILSVLLLITATLTDDFGFNSEDALGPDPTTKKPKEQPVTPKKPGSNDGSDLFDALGPDPTQAPKKPSSGDSGGFDSEDALKPGPTSEPKKPAFKPPSGGGGGNINDNDSIELTNGDYKPDGGRSGGRAVDPGYNNEGGSDQPKEGGSGPIAGIISAVGVASVGAASSYFAYQKKKLCFKIQGGADPESGKNHQGGNSNNQVFSNSLQNS